jgi:hypothetical protein
MAMIAFTATLHQLPHAGFLGRWNNNNGEA